MKYIETTCLWAMRCMMAVLFFILLCNVLLVNFKYISFAIGFMLEIARLSQESV